MHPKWIDARLVARRDRLGLLRDDFAPMRLLRIADIYGDNAASRRALIGVKPEPIIVATEKRECREIRRHDLARRGFGSQEILNQHAILRIASALERDDEMAAVSGHLR